MSQDKFVKRKCDVLSKKDKSFKGKWDFKIIELCNKINSFEDFYTTSSCSGRVVVMVNQEKKRAGLFIKVWHDKISFFELNNELEKISTKKSVKFKMESCALNVGCRDLNCARRLCDVARLAGWKRVGIIVSDKRVMVSLNSTEKLEFPIFENRKILVSDEFLKVVVKEVNKKLERGWRKIDKLNRLLDN